MPTTNLNTPTQDGSSAYTVVFVFAAAACHAAGMPWVSSSIHIFNHALSYTFSHTFSYTPRHTHPGIGVALRGSMQPSLHIGCHMFSHTLTYIHLGINVATGF